MKRTEDLVKNTKVWNDEFKKELKINMEKTKVMKIGNNENKDLR